MNVKKTIQFLFLKPAFTSRNVTSILLVGVFFGVYIVSGGSVRSIPKVTPGDGFGIVQAKETISETKKTNSVLDILTPSSSKRDLFNKSSASNFQVQEKIKERQNNVDNKQLEPSDRLKAIQSRLNNRISEE